MKRKKKKIDDDMPVGKLTEIPDFLPPPEQLVSSDGTIKVTIFLTKDSVDFFKKRARKQRTKYQKMIRMVVDKYAKQFNRS